MRAPVWILVALLLNACSKPQRESDAKVPQKPEADPEQAVLAIHPLVADRRFDATISDIVEREDPVRDGWGSEAFAANALTQLKQLGKALTGEQASVDKVYAPGFSAPPLRPENLETAYEAAGISVHRPSGVTPSSAIRPSALFPDAPGGRCKFKIISAERRPDELVTLCYFQMSHQTAGSRTQLNATWECTWTATPQPLLKRITISDHEEIRSSVGFVDCTASAVGLSELIDRQLIHGRDHWYDNLESGIGVEGRGNGIAIADANGDGLEDIYLCQPAALPNRLLLRQPDGSLRDASAETGLDWLDSTRGALFIDLDNDGDQDLVMAQSTQLLMHENDGGGVFKLRAEMAFNSLLFSLNAIDYDSDGDLDLYTCGYTSAGQVRPDDIFASPVPYHDANNGSPNALLRNDGSWQFSDVTLESGLNANNLRFSLASAWQDYDGDGDPDLYVANDFGRNNLYRNDSGTFTDVAATAGVEDIGPGMSAAWGDANNDGHPDLYVSNMFSSAGSRITGQKAFKAGASAEDLAGFKRHARGNSLFINRGDGTFEDSAIESGTVMGRWAWGSLFADFNNDGWRDLYVANGFVTADDNDDL